MWSDLTAFRPEDIVNMCIQYGTIAATLVQERR